MHKFLNEILQFVMLEVKGDGSACSAEMLLKPLPVHGFLKHTYIPR